jgi:hypothetical protein
MGGWCQTYSVLGWPASVIYSFFEARTGARILFAIDLEDFVDFVDLVDLVEFALGRGFGSPRARPMIGGLAGSTGDELAGLTSFVGW